MIDFFKKTLDNGLTVIVHEDSSTPMVAINVLYDVGSRDESPDKTGFAHLFEHLMFGGSENIPDFDIPIQEAGGENNAFTNADLTNFYSVLPAANIETALWLESDRMAKLNFDQKALDVQIKVVSEEFKETCLNQPYGEVWHHLSEMAYHKHPYRWPTIGKSIDHIENASLEDVSNFFYKHYCPSNAVLVYSGNISNELALRLTDKWFSHIEYGNRYERKLDQEPLHTAPLSKLVKANVPSDAFYIAYPMVGREHKDYYAIDLLSDLLASGRSSRFYQSLIKGKQLFTQVDAYISGSFDPGLFILEGKPKEGVSIETAKQSIMSEIEKIKHHKIEERELTKIKNKLTSSLVYSEINIVNKALNLAYFEALGDASLINKQQEYYDAVSVDDLHRVANEVFDENRVVELVYKAM